MKKNNRRDFIKNIGLSGAVAITGGLSSCTGSKSMALSSTYEGATKRHRQQFNMSGYGAPKLEKVRIGFAGLGHRGPGSLRRLGLIEGVEIKALCDYHYDRAEKGQQVLKDLGLPSATLYGGKEDSYKKMCERDDIDLIYQVTSWDVHVPIALCAMEHNKHAAVEVPAALTIEDCWKLVETSERTKKHCMMLENCCYDAFEMTVLKMVREGVFGEIISANAAYLHDQLQSHFVKPEDGGYERMWTLKAFMHGRGNQYPTHGLGPVCQLMNINRGDRMTQLVSMQSIDFQFGKTAHDYALKDSFYQPYDTADYRGNINTSIIKTEKGRTIMLQHDITSPRPYTRMYDISGTQKAAIKYPLPGRISDGDRWLNDQELDEIYEKYRPEITKLVGELAQSVGGHGGMDFIMDWRLIDCLRNGLPPDEDVYDAALWSSIQPLSQWSVANGSQPIEVPDFTGGSYKTNQPVDIYIKEGGTTGVKEHLLKKKKPKDTSKPDEVFDHS